MGNGDFSCLAKLLSGSQAPGILVSSRPGKVADLARDPSEGLLQVLR
jgi:hypothetical protein